MPLAGAPYAATLFPWARSAAVLRPDAHRDAVHGESVDVEHVQTRGSVQLHERAQTEFREMLVIDRVELVLFQEVRGMRHFHDEHPVVREQIVHAAYEPMQV